MNRILWIGLFLLPLSALGQSGLHVGLQVSPLIGFASIADQNNNDITTFNQRTRLGFSYGLVGEYSKNDYYGLHSGVNIVYRGFSYKPANTSEQLFWRVTSVQVPVAAKLRSGEIGYGLFIKGLFGLAADFQVGHSVKFLELVSANPPVFSVQSSKDTKRINPVGLTFMVGPGMDIKLPTGRMSLTFIYNQGLTNLNNRKNAFIDTRIRSNFVAMNVAYFFGANN